MSNNFWLSRSNFARNDCGFYNWLRNILCRRNGYEEKVYSNFSEQKFGEFKKDAKTETKKFQTEFNTKEKKDFLKGAEIAYETIINSQKAIKKPKRFINLRNENNFKSAIEERKSKILNQS